MKPNAAEHYGLVAIGRSGPLIVEFLQSNTGCHILAIETDAWSFSFAFGKHTPAEVLAHLRDYGTRTREMQVGVFLGNPVLLIRDEEFNDRFFLRLCKGGDVLEVVLSANQLAAFTDAMEQMVRDLTN